MSIHSTDLSTQSLQSPVKIEIKNEFIKFKTERRIKDSLTILIPICNLFEITEISIDNQHFIFSTLKLFELEPLTQISVYDSSVSRIRRSILLFLFLFLRSLMSCWAIC